MRDPSGMHAPLVQLVGHRSEIPEASVQFWRGARQRGDAPGAPGPRRLHGPLEQRHAHLPLKQETRVQPPYGLRNAMRY